MHDCNVLSNFGSVIELSIYTVRLDVLIAGENSTLLGYCAASCGKKLPLHIA